MDWFAWADITWVGCIVATLAGFLVGFVWFHARVLGKQWAALAGVQLGQPREAMPRRLVTAAVALFITVVLMDALMAQLIVTSVAGGLAFGAVVGFVMRLLNHVFHDTFEGRPLGLTLINGMHDVLALAAAGAVLGAFL